MDKIEKFLGKKCCVSRASNDYTFFDMRQKTIVLLMLLVLEDAKKGEVGKKGSMNESGLFVVVKEKFDKHIIKIAIKYANDHSKIRASKYKWVTLGARMELKKLGRDGFAAVLHRVDGMFLTIIEHGSQDNKRRGIHTVYSIKINSIGIKLLEKWREVKANG